MGKVFPLCVCAYVLTLVGRWFYTRHPRIEMFRAGKVTTPREQAPGGRGYEHIQKGE